MQHMLPEFLKKLDIGQLKLAVVAVLIIVIFVVYKWRKGKKEKVQPKKKPTQRKGGKTKSKSAGSKPKPKKEDNDDDSEGDENMDGGDHGGDVDENTRGDAEELFNLAHESLSKGMQKNDFKTLVGDLADDYTFIQLKQLYNDRERRNMNPLTTIDVTDYIKILQNEQKDS